MSAFLLPKMPDGAIGYAVRIGDDVPYHSEGPDTAECREVLLEALSQWMQESDIAPDEVWGHYAKGWRRLLWRRA